MPLFCMFCYQFLVFGKINPSKKSQNFGLANRNSRKILEKPNRENSSTRKLIV